MPKIDAPTVAEHHQKVLVTLVDAAEDVLREYGSDALTAEAVSSRAGLARNSIYRYVSSVDELRFLVVERYLPQWQNEISSAVADDDLPQDRIRAWAVAALRQSARTGHGWFMSVTRPHGAERMKHADRIAAIHRTLLMPLISAWRQINPVESSLGASMVIQLVSVGMKTLEATTADQVDRVISRVSDAVYAVVKTFPVDHTRPDLPAGHAVVGMERVFGGHGHNNPSDSDKVNP